MRKESEKFNLKSVQAYNATIEVLLDHDCPPVLVPYTKKADAPNLVRQP